MSQVFDALSGSLINRNGEELSFGLIKGKGKVIAIYFSAHWCPPCRAFTPKLAGFYKNVKKGVNQNNFEIIFVSSDRSEDKFDEYLGDMPWYAMPYKKRSAKEKLSKLFKVSGIPTLIFLDGENGQILNRNGRSAVENDESGQKFPWKSPTVFDLLRKGEYINNGDEAKSFERDIQGKVIGIYFSAHWCPPCKAFTPILREAYKAINKDEKKFEIIFVSSDNTESAYKEYFAEMPFLALPYNAELKDELSDHYEIEGIPTLILLDEDGNLITTSGRAVVSGDREGRKFPWLPEPVEELDEVSGPKINEEPCLIYIPGEDEESSESMRKILLPIATEMQKLAKSENLSQELHFFIATKANMILDSLSDFLNIDPKKKALFIVDVPSGKIYHSESSQVSNDMVKKFVEDYKNDKLEAKNIRD